MSAINSVDAASSAHLSRFSASTNRSCPGKTKRVPVATAFPAGKHGRSRPAT